MIVSHKHKFIFIKTNKTAGTSMEIALSKFCGPDDIITAFGPDGRDEGIRRSMGFRGPQNHRTAILDCRVRDLGKLLLKGEVKHRFRSHVPARRIRAKVGEQVWNSYFKFCLERNPWDRVVSYYYFRHRSSESPPAISEFVESGEFLELKSKGIELYTINGEIAVDKVCLYENLNEEAEAVRKRLGLPEELELPRAKSEFRTDRRSYREILGPREQARIAEIFSEEIGLFGYEF